ncbi:MAG: HIT family protein, partial [Nanoarchaeota archaeon]
KALSLSIGNGSYNIVMNNGKEAGQIVAHAHLHIIPRFKGDRLRLKWSHKKYEENEMKEMQEKIRKFL